MPLLKCGQTGHFFGYCADADVGFTCFECLGDFAPSGRRQQRNSWVSSRRRQSFHPPPSPPQGAQEVLPVSDESGRRRSKPWRCLQQRCHLLVCEECAEKLIDPNYVSKASSMTTLEQRSPPMTTAKLLPQAGAATPPENRASRELTESLLQKKPSPPTNTAAAAAATNIVNPVDFDKCPGPEDSGSDTDGGMDSLRSKLVYRRAGQAPGSFLGNNRRPHGRASVEHRGRAKEAVLQATKQPTILPENLVSSMSGTLLEVDSNENTEDEIDMETIRSQYTVRSTTQAANQTIKTIRWGQRMGGFTAVPRMGMA